MDEATHAARRLSFGAAADLYDRIRPSYPPAVVRWLLGDTPLRVLDLGAGTGIFTEVLVECGHEVFSVEPDPGMRGKLAAKGLPVELIDGCAESIPLPAGSVDAVVAAQAYHWFDQGLAHPEIARVLTAGGIWGPVWNVRDESIPWVKRMSLIKGMEDGRDSTSSIFEEAVEDFGPLFDHPEINEFRHEVTHDEQSLLALIRSRSYWLAASDSGKREMERAVRELAADIDKDETGCFQLPYSAIAYRCRKR